jgi:hypothetical protein
MLKTKNTSYQTLAKTANPKFMIDTKFYLATRSTMKTIVCFDLQRDKGNVKAALMSLTIAKCFNLSISNKMLNLMRIDTDMEFGVGRKFIQKSMR